MVEKLKLTETIKQKLRQLRSTHFEKLIAIDLRSIFDRASIYNRTIRLPAKKYILL